MKMTELFGAQLEREITNTRRTLENVPEGKDDWKPHEKSMALGYLAALVAAMPSWISMMIERPELDLANQEGSQAAPKKSLPQVFDDSVAAARRSLSSTTDEHLMTPWRLLVGGRVVDERARHLFIADTFTHLAHHRGQLTVYLRLNGKPVPSIYGPSADDKVF